MAEPVLLRVLRGSSDANIRFSDLRALLLRLGFQERIKGSHHIFTREDVDEILKSPAPEILGERLSGETGAEGARSV
jgi:hypothetical protein